eukprot:TRINITY_DN45859_c0_g1_i1.p1 TRINITY_DN45859_c0_g1~~TRINITY_DN45859_c0_g1_i1.p1  ORF type:complete len:262 (+),score=60.49 TRINITY_DN45859_c0_g1_i1:148-933(+)
MCIRDRYQRRVHGQKSKGSIFIAPDIQCFTSQTNQGRESIQESEESVTEFRRRPINNKMSDETGVSGSQKMSEQTGIISTKSYDPPQTILSEKSSSKREKVLANPPSKTESKIIEKHSESTHQNSEIDLLASQIVKQVEKKYFDELSSQSLAENQKYGDVLLHREKLKASDSLDPGSNKNTVDKSKKIVDKGQTPLSFTQDNELKSKEKVCLLYTSDAADDTPCVDLGGRRIIKKKKTKINKKYNKNITLSQPKTNQLTQY